MTATVLALNHVGISVADLDLARRFWLEGLGGIDHGGWSWPIGTAPADESLATVDTSASVLLVRTGTAFLEIFAFATPVPRARAATAPGVRALVWAVEDVEQALARALEAGGSSPSGPGADADLRCPDGTPIRLVRAGAAGRGPGTGLVGVEVKVASPDDFAFGDIPGPVEVVVTGGADSAPARPVDLGVNHLCLDVDQIHELRAGLGEEMMRWHHPVTESSGGIAAVCYGTTHDGVLVELLESRSPDAFLSPARLTHG